MSDLSEIKSLTYEVVSWANETIPERTVSSALIKMFEEIGELTKDLRSPGEYADVMIMLLDLANMHDVDIAQAVWDKMAVNRSRKWTVTETGTYQHE